MQLRKRKLTDVAAQATAGSGAGYGAADYGAADTDPPTPPQPAAAAGLRATPCRVPAPIPISFAAAAAAADGLAAAAAAAPTVLSTPDEIRRAVAHLRAADPVLARLIDAQGDALPERLLLKNGDCFHALARSIVYQQLSTKAASTIMGRVLAACGCADGVALTPAALRRADEASLRAAGLSARKASYLQSLAVHHDAGTVTAAAVTALADDAAITALTQVKGIGVWTAHMFLMFQLGRPDVLPVGDLGVRQGMRAAYGLKAPPGPEEMEAVAERWRPYRSVGAWYMWRALEGAQVTGQGSGSSTKRKKQSKA